MMPLQVVNRDELAAALRDVGATLGLLFRPYTATTRAPFESYLAAMARTGVLVARHGPLLANAMFLPPGVLVPCCALPRSRPEAGSRSRPEAVQEQNA
jgi:hypothetical protein